MANISSSVIKMDVDIYKDFNNDEFRITESSGEPVNAERFKLWGKVSSKGVRHANFHLALLTQSTDGKLAIMGLGSTVKVYPPRIPRPPNKWILYRREKAAELRGHFPDIVETQICMCPLHIRSLGVAHKVTASMVSQMWAVEPNEIHERYADLADHEEMLHKQKYPDYKYTPHRGSARP